MPLIPYVGNDFPGAIADAIRARRGDRGLTSLDQSLLNAPPIAEGWNKLLGAVRTGSSLDGGVREIMILRVAAHNRASYEWVQHEPVAKKHGVTQEQLTAIGDIYNLIEEGKKGKLTPLQQAAVALADEMTTKVAVKDETFNRLHKELGGSDTSSVERANKEMTEAVSTVAVYNMVSRFLVALDVGEHAQLPCPVPGMQSSLPSAELAYPQTPFDYSHGLVQVAKGVQLATRVHFHSMQAPWVVLVNSLMTNLSMWDWILPSLVAHFNVLTFDQRGHGKSSVPPEEPKCTMDVLADDVATVMDAIGVQKAHAIIGVSQGGATALNFAIRHGTKRTARIVACDTQPIGPQANIAAWDERIALARSKGMGELAGQTVPRWFAPGKSKATEAVRTRVGHMVQATSIEGFARSARSLQGYDLVSNGLREALSSPRTEGQEPLRTLLVAGELDGQIPQTLENFAKESGGTSSTIQFAAIDGAGHLPMCDAPADFVAAVLPFLLEI